MKNASRIMLSTFGLLVGLSGIEHGIGEILQGDIVPSAMIFPSWPDSAFFRVLNGEPALSLIPNLLVTGILATCFSLLFIAGSVGWIQRRYSGWILIGLAIVMLFTGGGVFPPVFGILVGLGAIRRESRPEKSPSLPMTAPARILAGLWPWLFTASLLSWFAMLPGVPALDHFFGVQNTALILLLLVCMFGFLLLAWYAAGVRDRNVANSSPQKGFTQTAGG